MVKQLTKKHPVQAVGARRFWRVVELLPFILPAGFVAFAVVAIALLLLGQLRSSLVFPLGLIAAIVTAWPVARYAKLELPGSVKERRIIGVVALVSIVMWVGVNTRYAAQDVLVYRDPGFYAVAGEWLKNHDNINLHVPTTFGNSSTLHADTAGFEMLATSPGRLYVQAPHLLPVMLGLVARVGGTAFMLHFNVVFGGLALLVVYGFACCFMRPRWALLAMGVLAISLPMIYFSRDTYSEPMDMFLIIGSLALLWLAQKSSSRWLWLVAGLAAGAATMSRIDAYLVVAALLAFMLILLALTKKSERPTAAQNSILFFLGTLVTSLLGWLDVSHLSAQYYNALVHQFKHEILLIALLVITGVIGVTISWRTKILTWLDRRTVTWRSKAAVILILLAAIVLASRPLWYVGYGPTNPIIFSLQKAAGQPVAHRTYAEQTVNWIIWYIGPVLTGLAVLGMAWVGYWVLRRRKYLLLLPLFMVLTITTLIYLNSPNITPYQIWAARRFLPVVFPGLCIFGGLALDRFSESHLLRETSKRVALVIIVLLMFAGPLFISRPFLRVRIDVPELAQVNDICRALPPHAAVLVMGTVGVHLTEPISAFCGVPTMRIDTPTAPCASTTTICTITQLPTDNLKSAAQSAIKKGYQPVTVISGGVGGDMYTQALTNKMTPVSNISYEEYAMGLLSPPKVPIVYMRNILMAQLNSDGSISPLKNFVPPSSRD